MKLFDDITRDNSRPAPYAEPSFNSLNRSARPESKRIRNVLEQWFQRIPCETQLDLCSRFRNRDDRQHVGAFFELYLHELLSRLDFIAEPHPILEGEETHPDFLVRKGEEQLFYLEATLAASSDGNIATKARENQVYDTLDRMESPNFFVALRVSGTPVTPPPGRRIRNFLEQQLDTLNPDKVAEQFEQDGFDTLPSWNWRHEGWRITFFAIPKSSSARGKLHVRPIGLQIPELVWHSPQINIRNSLQEKVSKYGKLDLPYVIAINVIDEFGADDIDISNALLGEEQVTVGFHSDHSVDQMVGRKPNGTWYGPNGPQNKRVSAVLVAVNLYPWSIAKITPILWHNPWAGKALSQDIWPLTQLAPDAANNQFVKCAGESGWRLLGLRRSWPEVYEDT